MTKRVNRLISGALLLTVAGIVSKVLSAMYRIPLQNLTGDLGFYTYQQMYPLIATVMILALYGFPLAVSRLTATQLKQGSSLSYRYYFLPVFFILLGINGLAALLLYGTAPSLAKVMQDDYLTLPLQLSALLFLFIPFISLFRGVFQAQLEMKQTAYSQIIEQTLRVTIIIISAWMIFKGLFPVRSIATLGVLASLVGMMAAVVVLVVYFLRQFPVRQSFGIQERNRIPWSFYIKTIVTFGLLAALNHLTLIFIQVIDVFTLVPQLVNNGWTPLVAMEQKGIFDRGIPLIQFGAVLGSSFALAFVPSITQQQQEEQKESIRDAISISVYVAFGATVGLVVVYDEVNRLLFQNNLGTSVLQILALSIFLLSLSITGHAILQAYGYVSWTVVALVISLMVKILLNYMLIPLWNTHGSALATVLSLSCLTALSIWGMHKKLPFSPWKSVKVKHVLGASSMMTIYLLLIKGLVPSAGFSRMTLFVFVMLLISSGALLYVVILLRYEALNERQISTLPFHQFILKIQKFVLK